MNREGSRKKTLDVRSEKKIIRVEAFQAVKVERLQMKNEMLQDVTDDGSRI